MTTRDPDGAGSRRHDRPPRRNGAASRTRPALTKTKDELGRSKPRKRKEQAEPLWTDLQSPCRLPAQALSSAIGPLPRAVPWEGWTDAEADAARLALELECLLTDKDVPMATISRWWDSAHEALQLHRDRLAAATPPAPAGTPSDPVDGTQAKLPSALEGQRP